VLRTCIESNAFRMILLPSMKRFCLRINKTVTC
jgi:hypothetical protein